MASCASAFSRNWSQHPALVEIDDQSRRLYVIGDVHGDFDHMSKALSQLGLIQVTGGDPLAFNWTGGRDVFVFLGDLIDKGPDSVDVLKFVMRLEQVAQAQGGLVYSVAGNHEMAFLANPNNSKTAELQKEISHKGLDLCKDLYSTESAIGTWLRDRPAAVIMNGVYMSHSGWAAGADRGQITSQFMAAVNSRQFDSPFTCGDHRANPPTPGFFNAEVWWGGKGKTLDRQLAQLGVNQVLFGHDPGAFGSHGKAHGYFVSHSDGSRGLFKMDVDMFEGVGDPSIYKCHRWRPEGGCAEPKIFIRKDKDSGPNDVKDFPVDSDDAPSQSQPDARTEC